MSKIDKIDYEIINLLVEDGRMSAAEIGRRLGDVTERTVRYRIDRLVRGGYMQVSAVPNPRQLGFSVIADVFLEVEADHINAVAQQLAEFDCITYVACAIGETDVSAQVVGHSTDEIYAFTTGTIARIPGVRKTTTSIVPIVLKDIHNWRVPESVCSDDDETT